MKTLRSLLIENGVIIHNRRFNGWKRKLDFFLKNPEFKTIYDEYFSQFDNLEEGWYCLCNDDKPENHKCIICGNQAVFSKNVYRPVCNDVKCLTALQEKNRKNTCLKKYGNAKFNNGNKISQSLKKKFSESKDEIVLKRKKTSLKRYGNETYVNSDKIKETKLKKYGYAAFDIEKTKQTKLKKYGNEKYNNINKIKNTMKEKYGVEVYSQHSNFSKQFSETWSKKTQEDKNKINTLRKQTCQIQYGTDFYTQTQEYKNKTKMTCLKKYGSDSYLNSKDCKNKLYQKFGVHNISQIEGWKDKINKSQAKNIELFEKKHNCIWLSSLMEIYGSGWYQSKIVPEKGFLNDGKRIFVLNEYISDISKYSSAIHSGSSNEECEIYEFLLLYLKPEEIIKNCRTVLKHPITNNGIELDIYIPSYKLAIEANGLYYHSTDRLPSGYHLMKTKECEEKGIRLIHIFEDDWILKQNICKSIILSALGIYDVRIFARNCKIKEISSEEYKNFLNLNHIQGSINSSIRFGLFYNDELIQVAGWGKSRFKSGEFELHRMCSKLNTQVIGGFSKLIKHSQLDNFISYIDRSLFDGKGYVKIGFKLLNETPISYFYWKVFGVRINRISAQKYKLPNLLKNKFDPTLSETENMLAAGYHKVEDCGTLKMKYTC